MKTIKIGNQVWMSENLSVDDGGEGIYHNNGETYYTWDAAMRVADSIPGWHLPTKEEFETLIENVGGMGKAGLVLKSTSGWECGGNGTDEFGFNASPAGYHYFIGNFYNSGLSTYFWSATEYSDLFAYFMHLYYSYDSADLLDYSKYSGRSVRLVKDYRVRTIGRRNTEIHPLLGVQMTELNVIDVDRMADVRSLRGRYYKKPEADKALRHAQYKRCMAMAAYWVAVSYQCIDDAHKQRAEKHHKKWLELAGRFK